MMKMKGEDRREIEMEGVNGEIMCACEREGGGRVKGVERGEREGREREE